MPLLSSARLANLGLALTSVLLTLLILEALFRILGIGADAPGSPWFAGGNHPRFLFAADPSCGYTLRPGFQGREVAMTGEFDVDVEIDERGMRSHPRTAPPGAPVVLALGDSMTFGEGVAATETFPALLEQRLDHRVENAGVPGYGSRQMACRLRELLRQTSPELMILSLLPLWDRQRNLTPFVYRDGYIVGPGYVDRLYLIGDNLYLADVDVPILGAATAYAKAYSRVLRVVLPRAAGLARDLLGRRSDKKPRAGTPQEFDATIAALEDVQRQARAAGAGLLVVLLDSREPAHHSDRKLLARRLEERAIPYLALDEVFSADEREAMRYPLDSHWNALGHTRAAAALAPRIELTLREAQP